MDRNACRSLAPFLRRERKAWQVIDGILKTGKSEMVRLDAAKFVMARIYPDQVEHSAALNIKIVIQIPSPTGELEYLNTSGSNRVKDLLPDTSAN